MCAKERSKVGACEGDRCIMGSQEDDWGFNIRFGYRNTHTFSPYSCQRRLGCCWTEVLDFDILAAFLWSNRLRCPTPPSNVRLGEECEQRNLIRRRLRALRRRSPLISGAYSLLTSTKVTCRKRTTHQNATQVRETSLMASVRAKLHSRYFRHRPRNRKLTKFPANLY